MKRRTFISKALLAAMALPFAVRRSKAWVPELIVACIVLCVGAIIIAQLAKLYKNTIGKPKPPPKNDDGNSASAPPGSPSYCINVTPGPEDAGAIADQSSDFQSPSGSFYTTMIGMNIETSTDLQTWTPCGSMTVWVSDDYLAVQQVDSTGNIISRLIPNWNTPGAMIPGFSAQFPMANQRFFRHSSAL